MMKIDPTIKQTFVAISKKSVELYNNPEADLKYHKRLLKIYDEKLSQEERVYIMKTMLELIHYRNIVVDPDNLVTFANIRIRQYFFLVIGVSFLMFVAAAVVKESSKLDVIINYIASIFKLIGL